MQRLTLLLALTLIRALASASDAAEVPPKFERDVAPLLKAHCIKCHGPAKQEGRLNLGTPAGIVRGGKQGTAIVPHDAAASRLWTRVESDEMPPDEPLTADQKNELKRWITAGAPGLPRVASESAADDHWAFRKPAAPALPAVRQSNGLINEIDQFVQAVRDSVNLHANPEAHRRTLIRRVSLDLTGLPPTVPELETFLSDQSPGAYSRMVDRYLASPQYGVRWGKYWLDAAGYADSNGYFSADTDRPLAYRYRDYVVRCFNEDRPFDRFIREQLAGDELAEFVAGKPATPEMIELLEATHFLRNGQDGSGESDGNPDEVRADRYYALESAMQNTASSLLGLTVQCAKCHDHKFEPISQRDYYRFQAVFYPTFHIERWVNPNDRVIFAPLPGEHERWEEQTRELEQRVATLRAELVPWVAANRPRGEALFEDSFDSASAKVADNWSATAPADDSPGGTVPVQLDTDATPAARIKDGRMQIVEGGTQGDSWISTKNKFDWTPDGIGESIQVMFDLVDNKLASDGAAAFRIGYFVALHDFDDNSPVAGGNLLIDGNPDGPTALHLDYPGADSRGIGNLGTTGYKPGRNYGIRVTNQGEGKYRLEQLVDWIPDDKPIDVAAADLPDGGFGFEYCCGRSFVVDNVRVERLPAPPADSSADSGAAKFRDEFKKRRDELNKAVAAHASLGGKRPGKIAWAGDMAKEPPEVHLLERGNYATRGEVVEPGALSVLVDPSSPFSMRVPESGGKPVGPRLAWANWLTQPDSRAAALVARVQVNRVWQQHFGTGLVATPDNLGHSGAPPTHPELLDWLAAEFIRSGWSVKAIHRLILNSATYRQSSLLSKAAYELDADNRYLWRYPVRRLDAEAIRDSMLAVSGELDDKLGGPYVPTSRNDGSEIVAPENAPGAHRRSLYLYQKRTQVLSFLAVFDAPSIVFNSVRRAPSTMPLQSLSLLNSEFAVKRAQGLAARLQRLEADESRRVALAFRMLNSREPTPDEAVGIAQFLDRQTKEYTGVPEARERAWHDLCQSLLASNEFLYVQ